MMDIREQALRQRSVAELSKCAVFRSNFEKVVAHARKTAERVGGPDYPWDENSSGPIMDPMNVPIFDIETWLSGPHPYYSEYMIYGAGIKHLHDQFAIKKPCRIFDKTLEFGAVAFVRAHVISVISRTALDKGYSDIRKVQTQVSKLNTLLNKDWEGLSYSAGAMDYEDIQSHDRVGFLPRLLSLKNEVDHFHELLCSLEGNDGARVVGRKANRGRPPNLPLYNWVEQMIDIWASILERPFRLSNFIDNPNDVPVGRKAFLDFMSAAMEPISHEVKYGQIESVFERVRKDKAIEV